jgi:hypothetical protein
MIEKWTGELQAEANRELEWWHVFVLRRIIGTWYLDIRAEFGAHYCELLFLPMNETDAHHLS